MKLVPIVEGHGDAEAVPVPLRRWLVDEGILAEVARPHRVPRGKLVQEAEIRRRMQLIAKETSSGDAVLAIFDADEDCAATLAPRVLGWMRHERPDRKSAVVMATAEFEAWYVAAAPSLVASGKMLASVQPHPQPESIRDAKGWLSASMGRRYIETIDQPGFAALFDFGEARTCGSFRKLERDLRWLMAGTVAN